MKLLYVFRYVKTNGVNLAGMAVMVVEELDCISERINYFMNPVGMKDRWVNVVIVTRWGETKFKRYFNACPIFWPCPFTTRRRNHRFIVCIWSFTCGLRSTGSGMA